MVRARAAHGIGSLVVIALLHPIRQQISRIITTCKQRSDSHFHETTRGSPPGRGARPTQASGRHHPGFVGGFAGGARTQVAAWRSSTILGGLIINVASSYLYVYGAQGIFYHPVMTNSSCYMCSRPVRARLDAAQLSPAASEGASARSAASHRDARLVIGSRSLEQKSLLVCSPTAPGIIDQNPENRLNAA